MDWSSAEKSISLSTRTGATRKPAAIRFRGSTLRSAGDWFLGDWIYEFLDSSLRFEMFGLRSAMWTVTMWGAVVGLSVHARYQFQIAISGRREGRIEIKWANFYLLPIIAVQYDSCVKRASVSGGTRCFCGVSTFIVLHWIQYNLS